MTAANRPRTVRAVYLAVAFLAGGVCFAQPTGTPKSDGGEEKLLQQSITRTTQLVREGKFADALDPAQEGSRLAARIYGAKDWRAYDAGRLLELVTTGKVLPADKQRRLVEAFRDEARADALERTDAPEALKLVLAAADAYAASLGGGAPEHGRALSRAGRRQLAAQQFEEADKTLGEAVTILRPVLPKDHTSLAECLNSHGVARLKNRKFDTAKVCLEEAFAIYDRALPEVHPAILQCLNNLWNAQRESRDFAGAKKTLQETLRRRLLVPRPADPTRATAHDHAIGDTHYNLGHVRHRLGDFAGSAESYAAALAIYRKTRPKGDSEIADCLDNVGIARQDAGEYAGAKVCHLEALEVYRGQTPPNRLGIAASLNGLGNVQRGLREYDAAIASHKDALGLRRDLLPKNHPKIAESLLNLGSVQLVIEDFDAALKSFEGALEIHSKAQPQDPLARASCLNNLGVTQRHLRDYGKAEKNLREALDIRRWGLSEGHPDVAQCLENLGNVRRDLLDFPRAKELYEQAHAITRAVFGGDHRRTAACLNSLGLVQQDMLDVNGAKATHLEALRIRRKVLPKGHPDIAQSLGNYGLAQHELQDLAGAKASHLEALDIRRSAGPAERSNVAVTLNNLALVRRDLREYGDAAVEIGEAEKIVREIRKPGDPLLAEVLTTRGILRHDLRKYEEARTCHDEALGIRRKVRPAGHPDIAASLANLGNVEYELRDYERAKQYHMNACDIFRMLPRPDPRFAISLNNLGAAQRELRDHDGARKSFVQALDIFGKTYPKDHLHRAMCLNNLGIVLNGLGELAESRKCHTKALEIRRNAPHPDPLLVAESLQNMALVEFELRQPASARKLLADALEIYRKALPGDHPIIAECLNNVALIDLASDGPNPKTAATLREGLGIQKSHQLALAPLQAEHDQLRTAAESRRILSLYLSTVVAQGPEALGTEAYTHAGALKGLVTARQLWARGLRTTKDKVTLDLVEQLRAKNLDIFRLALGSNRLVTTTQPRPPGHGTELAEREAERKALERELAARSEAFRYYQSKASLAGIAIRDSLPKNCVLIDFVQYTHVGPPPPGKRDPVVELRMLAFVVRPGNAAVRLVELGSAEEIGGLVSKWRERFVELRPVKAGEKDPGEALRAAVWGQLEKFLGEPEVVLVSPDGPLNFIPFAALPGKKNRTYLIHEYAFAVAPAPVLLPDLLSAEPARSPNPTFLLVGGVNFGPFGGLVAVGPGRPGLVAQMKELHGSEREAFVLKGRFQKTFPRAPEPLWLTGLTATKAGFLAALPERTYVHLATHGFFADETEVSAVDPVRGLPSAVRLDRAVAGRNPGVLSGVVFAGINAAADGAVELCLLTALEAAELDFRAAELVTLSACDTGRGRTAGGEGVVALQRALHVGGARSVVASQWRVGDDQTEKLMSEFYKQLWAEKPLSKVQALRQAQLEMIKSAEERRSGAEPKLVPEPLAPGVWAAFTLAGDWR